MDDRLEKCTSTSSAVADIVSLREGTIVIQKSALGGAMITITF